MTNPWDVSNLEVFLYFCCPECEVKIKDCQVFMNHALDKHEHARKILEMNDTILDQA